MSETELTRTKVELSYVFKHLSNKENVFKKIIFVAFKIKLLLKICTMHLI